MCIARVGAEKGHYVIAESMYLLRGQTSPFEAHRLHVEEGGNNPSGGAGIVAASNAKARKPSPGFEGVNG